MSLLRDILAELVGMFWGDARLSLGVLGVVAAAAIAAALIPGPDGLVAGAVLTLGCVAVFAASVFARARKNPPKK